MEFENTSLWNHSLGIQGDQKIDRLRSSYLAFRENMRGLLDEVRGDFPNLTDHSIEHVDNLWRIASLITGDNYPINPLEGFILGCSFLVHDSVLSYKAFGGKDALRSTIVWKDNYQDIIGTECDTEEGRKRIDFKVIRQLHAKNCGEIIFRQFPGMDGVNYFLLTDDEMRIHYGQLIGDIASSHHWETDRLSALPTQVNALAIFPFEWTINPRKLACILRCADAAAIDSKRAPEYLFRLLRLNGVSRDHWVAQNRLGVALDENDKSRLVITSTHPFEEKDYSAWNVAYDAVKVVEDELNKCQDILSEQTQFQVKGVAGAHSRKTLASYITTKRWTPSDVNVHISDVAHLIMTLGGKELYGKEDHQLIVIRELIQNARDAIKARRVLEGEDNFRGKITVQIKQQNDEVILCVTDNGVGMSLETISHSLLDFGNSFWHGDTVNVEFPGLKASGFKSVGQFGIGFFSVFMISKSVLIESRKYTDGLKDAHLVKFPEGLTLSPIFANYTSQTTAYSTIVSLILDDKYKEWPIEYEAKKNKLGETNFKVPFSAMLSTLVAGLDVDVYYKEFDKDTILVHHRIDASDLDKKAWLRSLSLADYQHSGELDDYIEKNYQRLEYIRDEHNTIVGLAAIGTRFAPITDFLSGSTIGGLLTSLHSRTGEFWIGILEHLPAGAKREGSGLKASSSIIKAWTNEQVGNLGSPMQMDFFTRFRLQLAMQYFKTDPSDVAVAFCLTKSGAATQLVFSLEELVNQLVHGKSLVFVDSLLGSKDQNGGHGDVHLDFEKVRSLLNDDELLYNPIMNSGFLSFRFVDGIPENNNGFLDCLYRTAMRMGHKLLFSYRNDYVRSNLGIMDRAVIVQV